MSQTLGMTGMDPATEAALKAAFEQANARLGQRWRLLPETDADNVIVDMDSMYGPMSWLRLHGAGKRVIGLTSAPRTQADFRLGRPFDANGVLALLQELADGSGETPDAAFVPSGMAPAPVPQDQLPEEQPRPLDEEAKAPAPAPGLADSVEAGTLAPTTLQPAAPAHERRLGDWLMPGALSGRVRYRNLLIDAEQRQYHGPATLKPLAGYFDEVLGRDAFASVDGGAWERDGAALGAAQPLLRLQWYAGLLAGNGALMPGFDPQGRYKLSKWPQTEREFPKHFRIATAMMKGPATLDEVAAASGVGREDVIDFVNANLVTGYAELVPDQPTEPTEPQKAGLFGRLRGK